jgi:NADPH-dependent ferric siderophore reductase
MPDNEAAPAERPGRYRGMRILRVLRTATITPRMRRITLGGEEFAGIAQGPNIKLLIPPPGLAEPEWPMPGPNGRAIWPAADKRPAVRTYSVRRFDAAAGELDVDFVLHGDEGPASWWAARAQPGNVLGIGGPGGRTVGDADWYLLAGDHTALPAIGAILEKLPAAARGHAMIEVPDAREEQHIRFDADIRVEWLHRNGAEAGRTTLLQDAVRRMPWPDGVRMFVWAGCESSNVRAIRTYVRDERGLNRRQFLAIGYWQYGMDETGFHDAHNNDRDEDYFRALREEQEEANRIRAAGIRAGAR